MQAPVISHVPVRRPGCHRDSNITNSSAVLDFGVPSQNHSGVHQKPLLPMSVLLGGPLLLRAPAAAGRSCGSVRMDAAHRPSTRRVVGAHASPACRIHLFEPIPHYRVSALRFSQCPKGRDPMGGRPHATPDSESSRSACSKVLPLSQGRSSSPSRKCSTDPPSSATKPSTILRAAVVAERPPATELPEVRRDALRGRHPRHERPSHQAPAVPQASLALELDRRRQHGRLSRSSLSFEEVHRYIGVYCR